MTVQNDLLIENAKLIFRNFAGKEQQYNSEGDRNFSVVFDKATAEKLIEAGWNVKALKAREEGGDPDYHMKVSVSYGKGRPPNCVMITSRGRSALGADEVEIFDWADIKIADLLIHPYNWDVNGEQGTKAYLKSAFITINENALDLKYADLQEAGNEHITAEDPLERGYND